MTIESELQDQVDEAGLINPAQVHDWAQTNPNSEIAAHLEWNDERAGYLYRLGQIRRLVAVYIRDDRGDRRTISLIPDRHGAGGYRQLPEVISHAEMRAQALRQALADLRRVLATYQWLAELAGINSAIELVERETQDAVPRRTREPALNDAA